MLYPHYFKEYSCLPAESARARQASCAFGNAGFWLQCREGHEGDNFYVIEEGVFKATKMVGPVRKELFTYENHGAFGELAMMYNCPRAATVEVGHVHA